MLRVWADWPSIWNMSAGRFPWHMTLPDWSAKFVLSKKQSPILHGKAC
jgi:hypothetical protein